MASLLEKLAPILYEDDHILAVAKPAGVDVGQLDQHDTPGLADAIIFHRGGDQGLVAINRLSRYESGVLLLGKTVDITEFIRTGLKTRRVRQDYLAIVNGKVKDKKTEVSHAHGSSRGRSHHGQQKSVFRTAEADQMIATVIHRLAQAENRALVRVETTVESTHALKAQLRATGMRVLGDSIGQTYGVKLPHEDRHLHLKRLSFHHPERKQSVVITAPVPRDFSKVLEGDTGLSRKLEAALARRIPCFVDPDTTAFRLITGEFEGVGGIVVEQFGDVAVIQVQERKGGASAKEVKQIANWYRRMLKLEAVYAKAFPRDRSRLPKPSPQLYEAKPVLGNPVDEEVAIRENSLRFAIKPYDGYSVGLFLDQRDNRNRLREMAEGKRVLNLFAYTCGFSVAAAAGGAEETVSVDISTKSLEWGQKNFKLNGLPTEGHWFFCNNAFDYFPRAQRQGRMFDIIVIDAPSFARGRKKNTNFSIKTDLTRLVREAADLLEENGVMMVSMNHRQLSTRWIIEQIQAGAAPRRVQVMSTPPLPVDFDVDRDHAKTAWVRIS